MNNKDLDKLISEFLQQLGLERVFPSGNGKEKLKQLREKIYQTVRYYPFTFENEYFCIIDSKDDKLTIIHLKENYQIQKQELKYEADYLFDIIVSSQVTYISLDTFIQKSQEIYSTINSFLKLIKIGDQTNV